jgi:hypothetical protein
MKALFYTTVSVVLFWAICPFVVIALVIASAFEKSSDEDENRN